LTTKLTGSNPSGGEESGISVSKTAGFSLGKLRTFSSFKNPVYRIYYGGMIGQMAAMNMQNLARSLLIYRITNSPGILGIMSFANAVPMLLFSLYGGVIADRVQKKYVLLIGQAISAIISLVVAIALHTGYMSTENSESWWILIVTSIIQGATMGLMMPSRQAIISEIVSEEELMNAISLNTMGMNTLQIIAPAITGFLIDAIGFAAVYYAMTGTYLIAVVFFFLLPKTSAMASVGTKAIDNIKEGLKYVRHDKPIFLILMFSLIVVFLSMPYGMLMPIFAEDILKVGASGMGILLSVAGIGSILGSIVLASLPNRKRGVMMLASGILLGIALSRAGRSGADGPHDTQQYPSPVLRGQPLPGTGDEYLPDAVRSDQLRHVYRWYDCRSSGNSLGTRQLFHGPLYRIHRSHVLPANVKEAGVSDGGSE